MTLHRADQRKRWWRRHEPSDGEKTIVLRAHAIPEREPRGSLFGKLVGQELQL